MLFTRLKRSAAIILCLFSIESAALDALGEGKGLEPALPAPKEVAARNANLTPLMKHILFFAKNNLLSYESMMAAHERIGFKDDFRLKMKIWAIGKIAKKTSGQKSDELIDGISNFAQCLEATDNPASAKIWQRGGNIDYAMLDAILEKAEVFDGKKVITRAIIDDHLENVQAKGANSTAVCVYLVPITWSMVTKGSFDELFKYLGDIPERPDAMSVERFKQFYETSDEVLATLMDAELVQ